MNVLIAHLKVKLPIFSTPYRDRASLPPFARGVCLEGEVVLVLHAVGAGHVEDTEVEALLDDTLEDEVTRVVSAKGAGRVSDTEAQEPKERCCCYH